MANRLYYNEMFNTEIKERFLDKFTDTTSKTYQRIFLKNANLEEAFRTDMGNFNTEQIEQVLYNLNPPTINASKINLSIVKTYIDWFIKEGLRENNINPLAGIAITEESLYKFVNKSIDLYITDKQMMQVEDVCVNPQDSVIFRLIFEGVMGEGCSELLNLREKDVDVLNNTLTLKGREKKLVVTERCIELIKDAIKQEVYMKKNGECELEQVSGKGYVTPFLKMAENDYIIRSSITKTDNMFEANKHVIYRRINNVRDIIGVPALTVKKIQVSGMLKMAKDLLEEDGMLEKDQYLKIAERFNIDKEKWRFLKNLVNISNINKIYKNNI